MLLSWGPVLVLFVAALVPTLVSFLRVRRPGWLVHLAILQYTLNSLIFFGNSRYRYPIEPLCLILAAKAVEYCWASLRGSTDPDQTDTAAPSTSRPSRMTEEPTEPAGTRGGTHGLREVMAWSFGWPAGNPQITWAGRSNA